MRDTQREAETQALCQREKQAPCGELDVGLNTRSPGSCLGLKADAKLLSHPGIPFFQYFKMEISQLLQAVREVSVGMLC